MIPRFRKGQTIRQNDLNSIINNIEGRMIGGAGVDARKLGSNVVLDAYPRVARVKSVIPYNVVVVDKLTLETIKTKPYDISGIQDFNMNVSGDYLVFGSVDNYIRILNKTTLNLVNEYYITDHITSGNAGYLDTVTDDDYIYACYSKGASPGTRFYTDKYDFDFTLIASNDFPNNEIPDGFSPHIAGINNTENYLVMGKFILDKDMNKLAELDTVEAIFGSKVYCADTYILVGYHAFDGSELRKYTTGGVTSTTFDDSGTVNISVNGVTVNGSDVYWGGWSTIAGGTRGGMYRLNTSLAEQASLSSSNDLTGIVDLEVRWIVTDSSYLYVINYITDTWQISKHNDSDLSLVDNNEIAFDADGGSYVPQAMGIEGNRIYIAGPNQ